MIGSVAAGGMLRLGRGIATGGDDVAGAAEHVAERLLAERRAGRDRDLGAVQHEVVRMASDGPISPSGTAGSSTTRSAPTSWPARRPGAPCTGGEQHRLAGALDAERLGGVEMAAPA